MSLVQSQLHIEVCVSSTKGGHEYRPGIDPELSQSV
jgi:hypothetical protein